MKFKLPLLPNLTAGFGLMLLAFTGCKTVYTPAMQNVPMLQEKHDVKINVNQNNLQAAYAVTENVGVMVNGNYRNKDWQYTNPNNGINENLTNERFNVDGAAGYFTRYSDNGLFEVYGGGGYGKVNLTNHQQQPDNNFNERYHFSADAARVFIQPSLGITGDKFEMAFSTRLIALKYNNIVTNYPDALLKEDNVYNINKPTYVFAEPAVTMRYGNEWIKLQTQLMYSAKMNQDFLNRNPFNFNVSLHVNLSHRNLQQLQP